MTITKVDQGQKLGHKIGQNTIRSVREACIQHE
jgi:hypothetical protein